MRTLAFDGRMGASGDMILASLLAAGADRDALAPVENALDVHYDISTVVKNGISARRVRVRLDDAADGGEGANDGHDADGGHEHAHEHGDHSHGHEHHHHAHDHSHGEGHTHDHSHGAGHTHDHSHGDHTEHPHDDDHAHGTPAEGHGPHRAYAEVVEIVESMGLPNGVERDAKAIFRILGEAEAAVHGTELDETHFHEVGADDAIADIVGACLLLADLDVERVVTSPLSTGGGEQSMAHGTYPVPTPAVVEIAQRADWSLKGGPVEAELLTPTGAAILAHVAEGVESLPTLEIDASGYGAGGYDFPDHPNVLRTLVGDGAGRLIRDEITVLETNLDDAAPELLGGLQSTLKDVGARDVTILPATMKKSRPGHLVKVIVKPEDAERVANRLAVETGTLGIREHGAGHRWTASRRFETAELEIEDERHEVAVKVASDAEGAVYDYSAEFDEAQAVADETGLPIREVMRRAENIVAGDD
ncbi:nickel pincer cofactor biosynthesis protein LarC [Halogeometricum borinquense]|uniref:Putative nickel insertion protein n=1 Tax=Halogeometricum borinquense TaxID=60847 RepID=A0A482TJ10_9EURY|nr:nickel pincer cofactor biosynthesis protein LarC [Halogeometricum borinquense]RYJ15188.1 nickel pincer cofactor biosynthesis protein LarC [Halogeometricum borinquense]